MLSGTRSLRIAATETTNGVAVEVRRTDGRTDVVLYQARPACISRLVSPYLKRQS